SSNRIPRTSTPFPYTTLFRSKYLDDFVNQDIVKQSVESFLAKNKLEHTSSEAFESYIKSKTDKNIDWFFNDYLKTRKKIDFKIKIGKHTSELQSRENLVCRLL